MHQLMMIVVSGEDSRVIGLRLLSKKTSTSSVKCSLLFFFKVIKSLLIWGAEYYNPL